jgi:hypothetical protein
MQDPTPPGGGTKALALIAAFFIPLVGIILFFMWRTNPMVEYQQLGRNALIATLVGIALGCICYLLIFVVAGGAAMVGN